MTPRHVILFIAILASRFCYGQEVMLKGIVLSEADSTPVQFVTIINQRTHDGTISGIEGHFSIPVIQGDTVRFTAVGFETFYLVTNDGVSKREMTIWFKPANYQLNQVTVTPYMNKEVFRKAFMEVPPDPNRITLNLPPQGEIKELGETKPIPLGIRILTGTIGWDPVLDKLRKETKEVDKWKKWENDVATVNKKYNKDVVKTLTGMPDKELETFMKFCSLQNEFLLQANDYDIAAAVKQCYVAYQEQHCDEEVH